MMTTCMMSGCLMRSNTYTKHAIVLQSVLQIRKTLKVSVFPVGFLTNRYYEGPTCSNDRVISWKAAFAPEREFPTDMAGFAVHLKLILDHPQALQSSTVQLGAIETEFLQQFLTRKEAECRGSAEEVCLLTVLIIHSLCFLHRYSSGI